MAGTISFTSKQGEKKIWTSANWVYWGFMDILLKMVGDNSELLGIFEKCKYMQGIYLDMIEEENSDVYISLVEKLINGSDDILENNMKVCVEGRELDDESQKKFLEAIKNLNVLIKDVPLLPRSHRSNKKPSND